MTASKTAFVALIPTDPTLVWLFRTPAPQTTNPQIP